MSRDDDGTERDERAEERGESARNATSKYPLSRLSAPHDLVDVAREIQQADATLGNVTVAKLKTIAEQIRALQAQAQEVLDEAKRASELHRASCNFQRRPGHVYHLYRRGDGRRYWSMVAPSEWGTPPDAFEGSFRLELDMTWTRAEEIEARDEREAPLRRLLGK